MTCLYQLSPYRDTPLLGKIRSERFRFFLVKTSLIDILVFELITLLWDSTQSCNEDNITPYVYVDSLMHL